jgi:dihydroxyacetone kinase-like protein
MVDALEPAIEALRRAVEAERPLPLAMSAAAEAAEEGMRATIPMQARKGRASYLGERSIGHQDPGATSAALVMRALESAVAREA